VANLISDFLDARRASLRKSIQNPLHLLLTDYPCLRCRSGKKGLPVSNRLPIFHLILYLSHMTTENAREYCLSLKSVTESCPFGDDALVFKVMGKMFALLGLESKWLNLK
jgi:hypothetical protein